MAKINDGGPAFPIPGEGWPGMTLRQYYAGQMLAGMMANEERSGTFKDFAADAAEFADALIAELDETQNMLTAKSEFLSETLIEMWATLEEHEPESSYADAWSRMLKERTLDAMRVAYYAAPRGSAAAAAAEWAWSAAKAADLNAQRAIDALRREVKP